MVYESYLDKGMSVVVYDYDVYPIPPLISEGKMLG